MSEVNSVSGRSTGLSETSSQAEANNYLEKRRRQNNAQQQEEEDLLEQNKTLQEAVFSSMYVLVRAKTVESWKMATLKSVLEVLIPFLVAFNPTLGWPIETSNPVWQAVRWALPRSPIARIWGYDTYIIVLYVIVGLIYAVLAAVALLTLALRKQEHSKSLHRFAKILQRVSDLIFSVFYISILDYLIFPLSCDFTGAGRYHSYWTDVQCLSGKHIITMIVASVTAIVFFVSTALVLVAGCELNPLAKGILASPVAAARVKGLLIKAVYVIAASTMGFSPRIQAVTMFVPVAVMTWFFLSEMPFLRFYINCLWIGGGVGVLFTCSMHLAWDSAPHGNDDVGKEYVKYVLYGIFPSMALGTALSFAWVRVRLRVLPKFRDIPPNVKLRKVHKFSSPEDVEVLARAMRHFDSDGFVLEDCALLGETIIKCGMAVFPGNVALLVLYANFLLEVKRDGPAARTQLQLALKAGPSLIQRYQIFYTIENSKRLKDGQEGQLDLQSYVEFKRNYRAVIRLHKAALDSQRSFWQVLQHSTVRTSAVEAALRDLDVAADAAQQVYLRVLERYPNNGKLLRCYGKFLEDVRNDPMAAVRAYTEAARNGGGDGLLSLDLKIAGTDKPEFLTSMDLHEDACMVINAEGMILMVNSCVTTLLGYTKSDLEGANVSVIMPQPFAGRHTSYLNRYVQGGEPRILDTVRDVVALHKERYVFPLRLCVTKLSGVGSEAVFLGLMRPEPLDTRNMRVWVAPNGAILCADQQFSSLTGLNSDDLVGRNFQSLAADVTACEALLELCNESPYDVLVIGTVIRPLDLIHRYLPPVSVEIKVTPGGTDAQRILVFNCQRVDGSTEGLLVVDTKGALTFATWDMAAMLGYPLKKFLKMRFEQLLPSPFSAMHAKHLREQAPMVPPVSCRAGAVVHMVNCNGMHVPVKLHITTKEDPVTTHFQHVIQVTKVDHHSERDAASTKCMSLLCAMDGRILAADPPESNVFGFTAATAIGSNLADCVDIFAEWRGKGGDQLELLLLNLLDRESELPGCSCRVKVHPPLTAESLPNIDPQAPPRQATGVLACLQTEMVDQAELDESSAPRFHLESKVLEMLKGSHSGLVRIVLWRCNLLTGVMELDDHLYIRKVDLAASLIIGTPSSAISHVHLGRLLDNIPHSAKWEEMMSNSSRKKSAMKGSVGVASVSPPKAFVGKHPDGGTMRVILQGVSGGPSGRITATLHPDTAHLGAHTDISTILSLNGAPKGSSFKKRVPQEADPQASDRPESPPEEQEDGGQGTQRLQLAAGTAGSDLGITSQTNRLNSKRLGTPPAAVHGHDGEREGRRLGTPPGNAACDGALSPEEISSVEGDSKDGRSQDDKSDSDTDASESDGGEPNADGVESQPLHANNQSQFMAEWVRSLAKQMSSARERLGVAVVEPGPGGRSQKPSRTGTGLLQAADGARSSGSNSAIGEGDQAIPASTIPPAGGTGQESDEGLPPVGIDPLLAAADLPPAPGVSRAASIHDRARSLNRGQSRPLSRNGSDLNMPRRRTSETSRAGKRISFHSDSFRFATQERSRLGMGAGKGEEGQDSGDGQQRALGSPRASGPLRDNEEMMEADDDASEEARDQEITRRLSRMESNRLEAAAQEGLVPQGGMQAGNDEQGGQNAGTSVVGDDDDGASQSGGGPAFSDVSSVVESDVGVDSRRMRLLKRMLKVMAGPTVQALLSRLRLRTLLLLTTMLLTHVVCYLVLVGLINQQFEDVHGVHRLALAADRCQVATVKSTILEFCSRDGIAPVSVCEHDGNTTLADLRAALEDLEIYHQSTYLGLKTTPKRQSDPDLYDLWTLATQSYRLYLDVSQPRWINLTTGVWQLGNRFIASGRELLYWGQKEKGHVSHLRPYIFVMANGPWSLFNSYSLSLDYLARQTLRHISTLQKSVLILLVIEAAAVQLACIVYEWWLVRGVELTRRGSMAVGAGLPGPILRIMASKPLVVLEDSDDDDDDDDNDRGDKAVTDGANDGGSRRSFETNENRNGGGAGSTSAGSSKRAASQFGADATSAGGDRGGPVAVFEEKAAAVEDVMGVVSMEGGVGARRGPTLRRDGSSVWVNGKTLTPSPYNRIRFMAPLALWECALVLLLAISYNHLSSIHEPLITLNMASRVIYRYTRVRMTALLLVAAEEPAERVEWRSVLAGEVANLESEYNALMYGGSSITQAGTVFQYKVIASTFESSSFANNFFREERCFRWDPSNCYEPSSPYYEVTHHGLDAMMRRILSEMRLLVADEDVDVTYNGTRYTTMYMVGTKDLYEGLQSSAQLFVDYMINKYESIKLMHTVVLVLTILLCGAYGLFVLRPYANAVQREAVSLAGLLSHVPAEMDVAAHTRQVLRAHAALSASHPRRSRRWPSEDGVKGQQSREQRDGRGWSAVRQSSVTKNSVTSAGVSKGAVQGPIARARV